MRYANDVILTLRRIADRLAYCENSHNLAGKAVILDDALCANEDVLDDLRRYVVRLESAGHKDLADDLVGVMTGGYADDAE